MSDLKNLVPKVASRALISIRELLNNTIIGIYLYGSAVMGGLCINSDVDIMVITNRNLDKEVRMKLTGKLMEISGRVGNTLSIRPLEVTVVNINNVVPWRYPPKKEFIYGEWLRQECESGKISEPSDDPDLAIILAQVRKSSISLFGPDPTDILEPIPVADIKRAIKDSLPELIGNLKGDERNVILTLARMWFTLTTGEISSKDLAAKWAISRLPKVHAKLLELASKAYLGECIDDWGEKIAM